MNPPRVPISRAHPAAQGGGDGGNSLLISPVGAPRPVYLAPAAQQQANLADVRPMVIVGLSGMTDFYPALIARKPAQARATVPAARPCRSTS